MALLRRRVPDVVRAVRLPGGERRVGWAVTERGQPVLATDRALLLPDGTRLLWQDVERAGWTPPRLTVLEAAEVEGTGRAHLLVLGEEGDLPGAVRTRVTASVAWSSRHRLTPAGAVRVVGRRVPGDQALRWQLVYAADTDLADPLVRAQAGQLLEDARRTVG